MSYPVTGGATAPYPVAGAGAGQPQLNQNALGMEGSMGTAMNAGDAPMTNTATADQPSQPLGPGYQNPWSGAEHPGSRGAFDYPM